MKKAYIFAGAVYLMCILSFSALGAQADSDDVENSAQNGTAATADVPDAWSDGGDSVAPLAKDNVTLWLFTCLFFTLVPYIYSRCKNRAP